MNIETGQLNGPASIQSWRAAYAAHPLASTIVLAIVVRCAIALLIPIGATYDIDSYRIVAETILRHRDAYGAAQTINRYPYLPLHLWVVSGLWWIASWFPLPFVALVKLPAIAADAGTVAVIYRVLQRRSGERTGLIGARLYAFSPVVIAVSAVHGQFDAIPLLCLLLSWYWLTFKTLSTRNIALAGFFLGVGILDKTWPALFALPLILMVPRRRDWLIFASASTLPVAVGIGIYLALFPHALSGMASRVLGYHSVLGTWGYTAVVSLFAGNTNALYRAADRYGFIVTLLAIVVVGLFMARRHQPSEAILLASMLVFFALSAGFSIQYLVWLVPFAIVADQGTWLRRYTLACLPWLVVAYGFFYTLPVLQHLTSYSTALQVMRLASLPAWIIVIAWTPCVILGLQLRNKPARLAHV